MSPPDDDPPSDIAPGSMIKAQKFVTAILVAGAVAVVNLSAHPGLVLSGTVDTGGDTGAHIVAASYLAGHLLPHFQLTGWLPGWFDGMPLYTYYFVLPDLLVAVASHFMSFNVAFKLATLSGPLLMPLAAYAFGRLSGLEHPRPTVLALFALPFVFDQTFTILGGNLLSTYAGEYSYSFGMMLALLALGLCFRVLKAGRYRAVTALVLAGVVLSHIVAALYIAFGIVAVLLVDLLVRPRRSSGERSYGEPGPGLKRRIWWLVTVSATGALLAAFWEVPFVVYRGYAANMRYQNEHNYLTAILPRADLWAVVLAAAGFVIACVKRSKPIIALGIVGAAFAAGFRIDPQANLWNARLLPPWFLSVYLVAGYAIAEAGLMMAALWRRQRDRPRCRPGRWRLRSSRIRLPAHFPAEDGERYGVQPYRQPRTPGRHVSGLLVPLMAAVVSFGVVIPPLVAGSGNVDLLGFHVGASNVPGWADWNYSGYQAKQGWPEFSSLMAELKRLGHRYGCGNAMWEYSPDLNRFGTTDSMMAIPFFTSGCVGSLGGLLLESSPTTPFYLLNQAEISPTPSEAMTGLPYGSPDVPLAVEQLQVLGVRYLLVSSKGVNRQAAADRLLTLIGVSGPWSTGYLGNTVNTTWHIYLVHGATRVKPLREYPTVIRGAGASQSSWLNVAVPWFLTPSLQKRYIAAGGPASFPRESEEALLAGEDDAGVGGAPGDSGGVGGLGASGSPGALGGSEAAGGTGLAGSARLPADKVRHIRMGQASVSFDVSRPGVPVVVDISYFPAWHAVGAAGPWRVAPNLMVVVPRTTHVELVYGSTAPGNAGLALTIIGVLACLTFAAEAWRRRYLR